MSKALQANIDELFQVTKDLMSLEQIKPYCDRFNEWVNQQNYSESSLGTLFSRYGLYSKFRKVPLEAGKNAESVATHDSKGEVRGSELKHYVVLLCGLNQGQWNDRNKSTRVIDRLENSTEVDPDTYLEVTGKLLNSDDPHELAVGIIAATGRRPHEILARAKFSPVEGKPYHVMFEGQGKKRGENPVFEIATLYPADFVIKCLARLRREPSTKALLKEVTDEFPDGITQQNVIIGTKRNKSLLRVVDKYFTDSVLNLRHGDEKRNSKALRSVYAVLAAERDCQGSFGAKILYASRILGHFTKEIRDDRDLVKLGTSAGYSDYYVSKPVPFPTIPEKEKPAQVRVFKADYEEIVKLQDFWKLPNQQSVVSRLIERQEKNVELGKQLQNYQTKNNQLIESHRDMTNEVKELKATINQLQKEKVEMLQAQPQQITVTQSELEAMIERMVSEKVEQALASLPVTQSDKQTRESKPTQAPAKPQEVIDWEGKSNAELWGSKARGASEEKIRRSYEAIALYNDTIATGDDDRLAVTNQALRELSGVNGLLVGDWLKAHEDEVISHNSKHGMLALDATGQPKRNNSGTIENYYNKRHGSEKITKILNLVNNRFLDGEAPVK